MTKFTVKLNQKTIDQNILKYVGGKAYSLIILAKNKIPSPNGFVVNSCAYDQFLKENNLTDITDNLNEASLNDIRHIVAKAKKSILIGNFSKDLVSEIKIRVKQCAAKRYAVRSSANVEDAHEQSWAGQFESYLNVRPEEVVGSIKKCWSSIFSEKVVSYAATARRISSIKMAVIVQENIESDVSGVCFTKNPITGDNDILIEAVFGLGELLVQGQAVPDSYEVERGSNIILEVDVNDQFLIYESLKNGGTRIKKIKNTFKQKLTGKEIVNLAKMAVKIEKIYGKGCDIEWCKKNGNLYILQSRPITTGSKK
ncbi:MAG: PEP/pyruvate-binding domain-containing protein [Minisyncoccales bacterium]